jgi:hypothetical protein
MAAANAERPLSGYSNANEAALNNKDVIYFLFRGAWPRGPGDGDDRAVAFPVKEQRRGNEADDGEGSREWRFARAQEAQIGKLSSMRELDAIRKRLLRRRWR